MQFGNCVYTVIIDQKNQHRDGILNCKRRQRYATNHQEALQMIDELGAIVFAEWTLRAWLVDYFNILLQKMICLYLQERRAN